MAERKKDSTITWDKKCTGCGKKFTDSMSSLMGRFPWPVRLFKVSTGTCSECEQAAEALREKLAAARDLHWTFETVKAHFEKNPPVEGQELIILDTSWQLFTNTYALVKVVAPASGPQKRIVIDGYSNAYNGQSFYRTGQNCFSPKGQVRLLPYHPVIGDLIKEGDGREVKLTPEEVLSLLKSLP
ncbi:MAG: hypothetical protein FPO08_00055 [Geobacter sp.]|nr:MAG: hypothetical protein FPO08_00055 [Geobacter sp.]